VAFRPDTVRGSDVRGPGEIDYRLARHGVVSEYRKGRLAKHEVCDAHPELLRAAKHVGEPTRSDCPVCARDKLVLLAYVFGDTLKQENGRVWSIAAGLRLAAAHPGSCCYVVEVCKTCQWNHLREAYSARRTATAG
jgi:hypothetical protein